MASKEKNFFPDDDEISISKQVLPELPREYGETSLGDPKGAKKQYRLSNAHIREYDDRFTIHIDRADPRKDPIGHLIKDAPESILATGTALYMGNKKRENGMLGSFLLFLVWFYPLNWFLRKLKRFLA